MSATFELGWLSRRPYRDFHPALQSALARLANWPRPEAYGELAGLVPQAHDAELPSFTSEQREALQRTGGYEPHVAQLRSVPTRPGSWHDFFNMTVWAHFPKLRWALNALHVDASLPKDPRNGRAPAQNLAASFDEAGMLVVSTNLGVLQALRALRFRHAFWERRDELLSTTRFWVIGHGLLESLLTPHARLSARSLLLHLPEAPLHGGDAFRFELDALVATRIGNWRASQSVLDPIPMLAIPGFADNDSRAFYDDERNIPFEPTSRRPPATAGSFDG